jgi:Tol biopolymer transport system component
MTTFKTNQERATQPRYTPDGQQIVFTAVTHNSRELWLLPTSGGKPDRVTNGGIATHGTMQP